MNATLSKERTIEIRRDYAQHQLMCAIDEAVKVLGPEKTREIIKETEKQDAPDMVQQL